VDDKISVVPRPAGQAILLDAAGVDEWLDRWIAGVHGRSPGLHLPENEARLVLEALLEQSRGGRPENLDRAGRAWGRASPSVVDAVERLSALRELLADGGLGGELRAHCAVDRIAMAAVAEVLRRPEEQPP
jgi:hypothetical protein